MHNNKLTTINGEVTCSVIPLNKENMEWGAFLETTKDANFFSTYDFWQLYNNVYCVIARNANNEIVAGIPFNFHSATPLFKICRVESSVIISNSVVTDIYELKKLVMEFLILHLKSEEIISLFFSTKSRSNDGELLNDLGFKVKNHGTYMLDITAEESELYKSFSKGHKSSIQKAIKANVQVRIEEGKSAESLIDDFCKVQDSLFIRKRKNFLPVYVKSKEFITKLLNSKQSKVYLVVAYFEDVPAAVAIFVSFNSMVYYYAGASDYQLTKKTQAANLLHLEFMKFAKQNGYTQYDFGGAEQDCDKSSNMYGVYEFKKHFGGEFIEYNGGVLIIRKNFYWIMKKLERYASLPIFNGIVNLLKK
jgi:lipid II:glycine glycyltransferase (peptidoglycan interpeptide bridge formation enzyme)